MKIDNVNKIVYVRQSWLNDMVICPERARLGIIRPEFRSGSDATIIGTAVHAGIESVLDGRSSEFGDMLKVVNDEYAVLAALPHKVTNIDQEKIPEYLEAVFNKEGAGFHLLAKDIKLPAGVVASGDPDMPVATVLISRAATEAAQAAAATDAAPEATA